MLCDSPDDIIHISHMTYGTFQVGFIYLPVLYCDRLVHQLTDLRSVCLQIMMKSLYCGGTEGLTLSHSEAVKVKPLTCSPAQCLHQTHRY